MSRPLFAQVGLPFTALSAAHHSQHSDLSFTCGFAAPLLPAAPPSCCLEIVCPSPELLRETDEVGMWLQSVGLGNLTEVRTELAASH